MTAGPRGPHQGLDAAALDAASQEYLRVFATHREALEAAIRVYLATVGAGLRDALVDAEELLALIERGVTPPDNVWQDHMARVRAALAAGATP